MALLKVCAVFDSALAAFMRPFFVPTTALAVRSFVEEVNRDAEDNVMRKHPADHELWCLGDYSEETGSFATESGEGPVRLMRAVDCITREGV